MFFYWNSKLSLSDLQSTCEAINHIPIIPRYDKYPTQESYVTNQSPLILVMICDACILTRDLLKSFRLKTLVMFAIRCV